MTITHRLMLKTVKEQSEWYDRKFRQMGQVWGTPKAEWEQHLDRAGVPKTSPKSVNICDLGCGDGAFIRQALKRDNTWCWGLDISEVALAWAKQKTDWECKGATYWRFAFRNADMTKTGFPAHSFHFVFSLGSLEHCIEPFKALREIRRILMVNGQFYLQLPNMNWMATDQPNELVMSKEEWLKELKQAGLGPVDVFEQGSNTIYKGGVL